MKKVLVLRFSSIGDIVLTTPVFRCLRQQAGVEVHFATKRAFAGLLKHNLYISKIHSLDKDNYADFIEILKAEQFDYIVDLHNNLRTRNITSSLRIPHQRFNKLNVQKWLLVNAKINRMPEMHIVDRYLAACSVFGIGNDNAGLDYHFSPEAESKWSALQKRLALPQQYICIAVGAAHATKQIPVAKIADVIRSIDVPVVLLGGPADVATANAIQDQAPKVMSAVGVTSIEESALLIKYAQCIVTPDTGMMHIAAALECPTVSIWGNTVPEFGMTPYMPQAKQSIAIVENKGLGCRPCSKIGHKTCPKKHFKCMQDIETTHIVEKIKQFIE